MKPLVVRNLVGYSTSTAYEQLVELMKKGSVVCSVDSPWLGRGQSRDVAQTIYTKEDKREYFKIAVRGMIYIDATDEKDFIEQCQRNKLEFILPTIET